MLTHGIAQENGDTSPATAPELVQDLQTEDVDTAPLAGSLWVAQPSVHESSSIAPTLEYVPAAPVSVPDEHVAAPAAQARTTAVPVEPQSPNHSIIIAHQLVAQVPLPPTVQPSPQPSPQLSPQRSSSASASQPSSPSLAPADSLRTRMQRHTFVEDDDSDDDDRTRASVKKALKKPALKRTGTVTLGKYRIAVESDGEESDAAQDDDQSMFARSGPAAAQQQAQEAAAAHAQNFWKPISMWSESKPASIVKSAQESAVHLSHFDLQLLHTTAASPVRRRSPIQVQFPSGAAPEASCMTKLPPERGRKWPLSNLFTMKAERKALTGLQLTADDARHLQDIESCIAQGGLITDQLRDVRAKLHKLQPQQSAATRASTQLKSSHTASHAEVRSMVGDAPQRNPFVSPIHARAATSFDDTQPYDCIRLLQSYVPRAFPRCFFVTSCAGTTRKRALRSGCRSTSA